MKTKIAKHVSIPLLFGILSVFLLVSCNTEDSVTPYNEGDKSTIVTLKNVEDMGVDFEITPIAGTRTSNIEGAHTDTYFISAFKGEGAAMFNSILVIEYDEDLTMRVTHYTDNMIKIATLYYDEFEKLADIEVGDEIPQTRGLSSWWRCTQKTYKEIKKMREDDIIDDIACSWISGTCPTLYAIAAGYDCA